MTIHTANCVAKSRRPLVVEGRNYGFTARCTVKGQWQYVAFGRSYQGDAASYQAVVAAKTRDQAELMARDLIAKARW